MRLLKRVDDIIFNLYCRNKTLSDLVFIYKHFNHPEWILKRVIMKDNGQSLKRRYPITEIMETLGCSKRKAYDYANALDAFDYCLEISDDTMFLLVYAALKNEQDQQ